MATKKKKKATSPTPAKKAVKGSKAPVVAVKPSGQKWVVIVGLIIAAALVAQGVLVFKVNKKKDVTLTFESKIATHGEGKEEVVGARNLGVSAKGEVAYVYGIGEGSELKTFSADGKFIGRFQPKHKADALNNVFATAYGSDGTVWACERGSGRILHLTPKLDLINSFKAPTGDLTGIAVDSKGQVWAASFGPKIYAFSPKGELIKEFTGSAKAALATAYRICFDAKDNLIVLDSGRGEGQDPDVKIYAPSGESLAVFMAAGLPFNQFSCIGVDKDLVVLNNNGSNGLDSQGVLFFNYKGKVVGRAAFASNHMSLKNVPALGIGANGHWALDTTPMGGGCDRFSYTPAAVK